MLKVHIDYEARSGVSLPDVGSYRWSIDPRFEILCAAVSDEDDPAERVYLWVNPLFQCPGMDGRDNAKAEELLATADLVYAHNAPNELANTWGALKQGKNCPFKTEPPHTIWRCTAAMARKAGLPNALEDLCEAFRVTDPKDRRGKALIKLFCEPHEDTGEFVDPRSKPEEWAAFGRYCVQDVYAETACGRKLEPFELTGATLETFQFDLRMNHRGVPINVTAARNAQKIITEEQSGVREEFRKLTGLNPTQGKKFRPWLKANTGLDLPNLQAPTIEQAIDDLELRLQEDSLYGAADDKDLLAQQILQLYQKVSYAAVAKIAKMLDCVCPDERVRGTMFYYGAGTGRWSSKLLQVQNFRKTDKFFKPLIPEIYQAVCDGRDREYLNQLYGDPLECLANSIRSFIHEPKYEALDGDYNAVEGRIGAWIANETLILEAWRRGDDLYKRAAAFVENVSEKDIQNPSPERDFGKVVELACQFGLGNNGFIRTCKKFGIACDKKKAQRAVHEYYRPTHSNIVKYWWLLDRNMREAIRNPGVESGLFTVRRIGGINFMLLRLPSGRRIAYPHPQLDKREPTQEEIEQMEEGRVYGPDRFIQVSYWGQIPATTQWGRIRLWGSKAFENEVQGIAADFMAHGAITAEKRGMPPFMLVHDQGLALRMNGQSAEDFEHALADLPSWAKGFPMRVECKTAKYYRK